VPPGPIIRRLFGPFERSITNIYRRTFVDLDHFATQMIVWVPRPHRILEVGCGEGAVTERLAAKYSDASITAIDINANIGRLFRPKNPRVTFAQKSAEEVAATSPNAFDLVVLCDVFHHVPVSDRSGMLSAISECMAPGGSFIFKDWTPSRTLIHSLTLFSDRYLTGDSVQFCTKAEIESLIVTIFGAGAIRAEASILPWPNNIAFLVRPDLR